LSMPALLGNLDLYAVRTVFQADLRGAKMATSRGCRTWVL